MKCNDCGVDTPYLLTGMCSDCWNAAQDAQDEAIRKAQMEYWHSIAEAGRVERKLRKRRNIIIMFVLGAAWLASFIAARVFA